MQTRSFEENPITHQKHTVKPNTPIDAVNAFKRSNGYFICETRNAGMTAKACRDMRKRALAAKKIVQVSFKGNQMVGMEWLKLAACAACKEYPR